MKEALKAALALMLACSIKVAWAGEPSAATCTSYLAFLRTTGCDPQKKNCVASFNTAKQFGHDNGPGNGGDGGNAISRVPAPGAGGKTQTANYCVGPSASAVGCAAEFGMATINLANNIGRSLCGDACGALGAVIALPLAGLAAVAGAIIGGLSRVFNVIGALFRLF